MSNDRHSFVAFYPSDWIAGTARMTRLQRSVYFDICCYNWDKAEACPPTELPLMLGDVESWREIVAMLVAAGKLIEGADGSLSNPKAMAEANKARDLWMKKSKGGKNGAAKTNCRDTPVESPDGTPAATPDETHAGLPPQNQNQNQRTRPDTRHKTQESFLLPERGKKITHRVNGSGAGAGFEPGTTTIKDPVQRLARFQQKLVEVRGPSFWVTIDHAMHPSHPEHETSLQACKAAAAEIGKGWPKSWPNLDTS